VGERLRSKASFAAKMTSFDATQFAASASSCPRIRCVASTLSAPVQPDVRPLRSTTMSWRESRPSSSSVNLRRDQGAKYQLVPNGLSQSNIGVRGNEEFTPGWSLVFDVNPSFDPYSLQISNGPRSLVENNNVPIQFQNENADSSRAGQWDNTRGYVGLSNTMFGTLTVGRETTFSNDAIFAYDPMGGSYAFSLIGNSSTYVSGVGDTETSRYNTSVKYQVAYSNVRAGALWQFGGYEQGNFDVGFDYSGFSFDAIYSYARDAVSLSTYSVSPLPKGVTQDDLKATLADINGVVLAGKYVYGPFKFFGGYENARFSPPSDDYPNGFGTLGGYTVLPGAASVTNYIDHIRSCRSLGSARNMRSVPISTLPAPIIGRAKMTTRITP
jgi:hypothetical protein